MKACVVSSVSFSLTALSRIAYTDVHNQDGVFCLIMPGGPNKVYTIFSVMHFTQNCLLHYLSVLY
jgi:hypothetical protein